MDEAKNYGLLREGDLVRMIGSEMGIVTEIQKWGQVQVFWPMTNKVSTHGKEWAELHFELILEEVK